MPIIWIIQKILFWFSKVGFPQKNEWVAMWSDCVQIPKCDIFPSCLGLIKILFGSESYSISQDQFIWISWFSFQVLHFLQDIFIDSYGIFSIMDFIDITLAYKFWPFNFSSTAIFRKSSISSWYMPTSPWYGKSIIDFKWLSMIPLI